MDLEAISTQVSAHLLQVGQSSLKVLAALVVAVLILVIGLYISRFVGSYVKNTYIISFVLAWAVIFYAVVLAAEVLHLDIIRNLFTQFLEFIPTLFVSVLILFAGLLFGKLMGNIIENSAQANNLKGGFFISKAVNIFIVFFCALIAVENLGFANQLVNNVVIIVLASLGLAFGIGVGLGSKELVADFLRELFKKEEK